MSDPAKEKTEVKAAGRYLVRCALGLVCLVVLVVLGVVVYLATPFPARQVSRLGSSFLQQKLTVDRLQTTGGTLYLRGVRLDNPPGFPQGSLATAQSVAIAPDWGDLLRGRQNFRLIALDGISVTLEKNSKGVWNFDQLQKLLAARKPSPAETRIRQLSVKNGALRVNGQGMQGIALQVFNVATKGSRASDIDLSFEDAAHNRFALKGKVRAGTEPALDLTLSAPNLTLESLASLLKLEPKLVQGGTGSLLLSTSLHQKELSASGSFLFGNMRYAVAGKSYPLAGKLEFVADYNLERDAARLKECRLTLKDLVQMHAAGTARDLKKERNFALDLGFSEIDLGRLTALLPERARRNMVFGGRVGGETLHLAGNGKQLTAASGTLQLRDGMLVREGRLLIAGLAGSIRFSRLGDGVLAQGRLSTPGPHGKALLESLDLPFNLSLSRQMKPLKAEIPAFSARVQGVPCSGRLSYQAAQENPLSVSLKVPSARLATLQPLLARYDLTADAGSASLTLEGTGRNAQQLAATVGVHLVDFKGKRGKNALAAKEGQVSARVRRAGGHLLVQGEAKLRGVALDGQGGDAHFNYRVADRMVYLEGGKMSAAGTEVSLAHLSAALPEPKGSAKSAGTPVSFDFDGATLKRRDLEVRSLTGRVRATLQAEPAGKWLDGTAELASGGIGWQGKTVAAPALKVVFSKAGARGELGGKLLGGTLAATVSGNPLAPAGTSFDLRLKDAELAAAASFIPKRSGYLPSDGLIELHLTGSYARPDGLSCRLESKGSHVALAGAGGKTLLSGAAFNLAGELAQDNLTLSEVALSPGPGVTLKLKGKVAHPFTEQRAGRVSFSLPETPVNSIIDPLISLLPRVLQEATLEGRLAADGRLDLAQGEKLLEGTLSFQGGRVELTQQKLQVSGINGKFPFSLDLSGKAAGKSTAFAAFSKENYPRLLEQLRKQSGGEELLRVDKIALGAMELGTLTIHASAGQGMTEIAALKSSLYEGAILGRGYLSLQKGVNYRGDLLINGLSLKKLCSIFPGIQGYISGRVDGVISIGGGPHGLLGLTGFTELWAREGSGEKMLVSKEFLQRLAKQKLGGFFFSSDRRYDEAEIKAVMEEGYLTFQSLKIVHTNLIGVKDLNVTIAPTQNRIALDHLLDSIKQAATRGKAATGEQGPEAAPEGASETAPATQEFKWGE